MFTVIGILIAVMLAIGFGIGYYVKMNRSEFGVAMNLLPEDVVMKSPEVASRAGKAWTITKRLLEDKGVEESRLRVEEGRFRMFWKEQGKHEVEIWFSRFWIGVRSEGERVPYVVTWEEIVATGLTPEQIGEHVVSVAHIKKEGVRPRNLDSEPPPVPREVIEGLEFLASGGEAQVTRAISNAWREFDPAEPNAVLWTSALVALLLHSDLDKPLGRGPSVIAED